MGVMGAGGDKGTSHPPPPSPFTTTKVVGEGVMLLSPHPPPLFREGGSRGVGDCLETILHYTSSDQTRLV